MVILHIVGDKKIFVDQKRIKERWKYMILAMSWRTLNLSSCSLCPHTMEVKVELFGIKANGDDRTCQKLLEDSKRK